MPAKILIAACLALATSLCANFALAQVAWTKFSDPAHEISVSMPNPVKASKSAAGGDQFDADDGDVSYKVSFRRRTANPVDKEEEIFCNTFADVFAKVMAEQGHSITIKLTGKVSGKHWQGRIYHYENSKGVKGALEIAISEHHNFILHVMGAPDTAEKTKRFFTTFEVN